MDRSLLINILSFVTSSYGLLKCTHIKLPPSLEQAGQKQFLTNISLAATISHNVVTIALHAAKSIRERRAKKEHYKQAFARATASAEDLQVYKEQRQQEEKQQRESVGSEKRNFSLFAFVNRHITLPLALVLESVVATVYWPLRIFAIGMILQGAKSRSPIPFHIDVSIHLLPVIYMLSDYYLSGTSECFEIGLPQSWVIISLIGLAYKYYLGALIDPSTGQQYPYPFLDVPEPCKSIIFVVITSFGWLFYVGYRAVPPKKKSIKKEVVKMD